MVFLLAYGIARAGLLVVSLSLVVVLLLLVAYRARSLISSLGGLKTKGRSLSEMSMKTYRVRMAATAIIMVIIFVSPFILAFLLNPLLWLSIVLGGIAGFMAADIVSFVLITKAERNLERRVYRVVRISGAKEGTVLVGFEAISESN